MTEERTLSWNGCHVLNRLRRTTNWPLTLKLAIMPTFPVPVQGGRLLSPMPSRIRLQSNGTPLSPVRVFLTSRNQHVRHQRPCSLISYSLIKRDSGCSRRQATIKRPGTTPHCLKKRNWAQFRLGCSVITDSSNARRHSFCPHLK